MYCVILYSNLSRDFYSEISIAPKKARRVNELIHRRLINQSMIDRQRSRSRKSADSQMAMVDGV